MVQIRNIKSPTIAGDQKKDRPLSGNDPHCLHSRRNEETDYLAFFLAAVFLAAGFFAAAFLAAGFFAAAGSSCDRALTL